MTLQDQINDIDLKISANNRAAADATNSSVAWLTQSRATCNQSLKKKRQECESDKAMKKSRGDGYLAIASAKNTENDQLVATKKSIQALLDAEAQSKINLSQLGIDPTSARIKELGVADGVRIESEATADSMILRTKSDVSTAEDKKKVVLIIVLSVAGIAIAIGTVLVVRKLKKKKKK